MKNVCKILMIVGAIIVIGTAGASDLDLITFNQMIIRALIGSLIFAIGYTGNRVRV